MQKHYDTCLVGGCGKATQGKQYCTQHASPAQRRSVSSDLRALIRSGCCDAKCVIGKTHEYGEQYCTKCKEPCCWKT